MFKKLSFLLLSIIITFTVVITYQYRYGHVTVDQNGFFHQLGSPGNDNYTHSRMILNMHKNITTSGIKLYFYNKDITINFPIYQYYNFSPYTISSLLSYFINNPYQVYISSYFIPLTLCSIGIYLINKKKKYSLSKILASISLFTLSPYLIIDILGRNAMSEVWGICLLPLLYYYINSIINSPKIKKLDLILFTTFAIIFLTSHNITILYGLIFFILYLFILFLQKKVIFPNRLFIFILPIIISSFYLMPIFLDRSSLIVTSTFKNPNISSYLSRLDTIFYPFPHSTNKSDNFPLQIGLSSVFLLLVLAYKKKFKYLMLLIALIILISFPIWNYLPKILYSIQFPYRLLGFFIFFIDIFYIYTSTKKYLNILIIFLSVFCAIPYLRYQHNYVPSIFSYESNYRNNYYYFNPITTPSAPNENNAKILENYLHKSTLVKKFENIQIEKNSSFALLTAFPNQLNKTIFISSTNKPNKKLFLYVDINGKEPLNNDLHTFNLDKLTNTFSFCKNEDNLDYSFRIVNFDTVPIDISDLKIYTNDDRLITSKGIHYTSTCDYSNQHNEKSFHFTDINVTDKIAIPYYYSSYNLIYYQNQKIKNQEPVMGDDNNPYILIKKSSAEQTKQTFTIKDSIFPFNYLY